MERVIVQFLRGAKAGQTEIFPVGRFDRISLGRDLGCDVRFDPQHDDLVSRNHASIEWDQCDPRSYVLTDLLSSNGTFVNGRRVQEPVELHDGDQIDFGAKGPSIRIRLERVDPHAIPPNPVTQTMPRVTDPGEAGLTRPGASG